MIALLTVFFQMSEKKSQSSHLSTKPSPFSRLHQRQALKVNQSSRTASVLMTLSDNDHKAIAALIQQWMAKSKR